MHTDQEPLLDSATSVGVNIALRSGKTEIFSKTLHDRILHLMFMMEEVPDVRLVVEAVKEKIGEIMLDISPNIDIDGMLDFLEDLGNSIADFFQNPDSSQSEIFQKITADRTRIILDMTSNREVENIATGEKTPEIGEIFEKMITPDQSSLHTGGVRKTSLTDSTTKKRSSIVVTKPGKRGRKKSTGDIKGFESDDWQDREIVSASTIDPLKIFLKQACSTPLLSREQEIELATKIIKGKYIEIKEIILGIVTGERTAISVIDMVELTNSLTILSKKKHDIGKNILVELKKLEKIATLDDVENEDEEKEEGLIFSSDATRTYPLTQELTVFCMELANALGWKGEVSSQEKKDQLEGRYARDHMIKANLRLVVKIAEDYSHYGVDKLDLIQEGSIGLMKACERFDPNYGAKFSTYGAWWIKQAIKRALANQGRTVRLPVHMVDKVSHMKKVVLTLTEELGRSPNDYELRTELGMNEKRFAVLMNASVRTVSLDAPLGEDGDTLFGEIIADEHADDPAVLAGEKDMHMQIDGLLEVLDERERKIIDARFGLAGQKPKTLEEVGVEFGVTRERIRQLQNIGLKKLRRALQKREEQQPKPLKKSHEVSDDDFFRDEDDDDDL